MIILGEGVKLCVVVLVMIHYAQVLLGWCSVPWGDPLGTEAVVSDTGCPIFSWKAKKGRLHGGNHAHRKKTMHALWQVLTFKLTLTGITDRQGDIFVLMTTPTHISPEVPAW